MTEPIPASFDTRPQQHKSMLPGEPVAELLKAMDGLRVRESPYLPGGSMLLLAPEALAGFRGSFRFEQLPPQYPEVGWKYEARSIVRRGMADVLEWLGDNAPRELPDEDPRELRLARVLMEQRYAMTVARPTSFVRVTGFM